MFFDDINDLNNIAKKCETAIFVVPNDMKITFKNAILLEPDSKSVITIDQVRDVIKNISVKQTEERFVIIRPADMLGEAAANAFLKNLEQPNQNVHFVLITANPTRLLSTILSRAQIYYLKTNYDPRSAIVASDKVKSLAKQLLAARSTEVLAIADEIYKKKEGVRSFALDVIGVAIEMLYKTYFITSKDVFLTKLPKFLAAYDGILQNGHVKLQIVANLC